MKSLLPRIVTLIVLLPLVVRGQQPVYLDPSQPIDRRVDDLLQRLTLQEKTSLLSTTAPAIERLKIPVMNGWNQSLHGIVWTKPTTMFPAPIAMAATWNTRLVHAISTAIADEGRAVHNYWRTVDGTTKPDERGQLVTRTARGETVRHNGLVYRSPVINISRDPRWGRIWEAFGEDPFLVSRMTVAYVQGMQGDHPKYLKLASTLKHYAVNNQERDRIKLDVDVSDRMLREYFLPHFRAGIVEGKAQSIMSSYNAINGVPGAEHKWLLTDVLRGEWKFTGFVVPDSGAVPRLVTGHKKYATLEEAAAKTILAGSDLDNRDYAVVLPRALERGLLTEQDIDRSLGRVLQVRLRLGELDQPDMVPYTRISPDVIDSPAHRQLALRAARESIVLLANEDDFLPLDRNSLQTIAVIGPFADLAQTGPNYTGLYSTFVKPLEGIERAVGTKVKVLHARGSGIVESEDVVACLAEAVAAAKQADVAILFIGTNEMLEREGLDRSSLGLPPVQMQLARSVLEANPKTVIVLLNGGPVSLVAGGSGSGNPLTAPAVLDMFWAGEEGGTAIAEVLFGDYNPGGRVPYTVYDTRAASNSGSGDTFDQLPPMSEYDITKGFTYMYYGGRPEHAFGHGLSYTTFDYMNLRLPSAGAPGNERVQIQVDIRNTGQRAGDEVVQLYVHDVEASVKRPSKQLAGFERIHLKPGETKTVAFSVSPEQLAFWDTSKHAWIVEPGTFDVLVGSSSADIRVKGRIEVTSAHEWTDEE